MNAVVRMITITAKEIDVFMIVYSSDLIFSVRCLLYCNFIECQELFLLSTTLFIRASML